MPAWEDYKAQAKARGSLAFELYVAHSTPGADMDLVKDTLPDHLAYQAKLEASGHLALAGPMSDETGDQMQGVGLIVYRAESFEAARALAEADPMHAKSARSFTLRKWMINEGSLNLSIGLSAQNIVLS